MKQLRKRLSASPVMQAARTLWQSLVHRSVAPVPKALRLDDAYRQRFQARNDTELFEIGGGMSLAVYWKVIPHVGSGPAFSIHAGASEPLKLDCFGPGEGHYHTEVPSLAGGGETRIWFPEATRRAQIDRALFEIERNAIYYLQRTPLLEGRVLRPDPELLSLACRQAKIVACRFLATIPQFQEPTRAVDKSNAAARAGG